MGIHSIDDLSHATRDEIKKAGASLQLKKRVLDQLTLQGDEPGLTLTQYEERAREAAKPRTCPVCHGVGKLPGQPPRRVGVIHPSSAHSCRYRLYLDVTGEFVPERRIAPGLQFTFDIGHAIHATVQNTLIASVRRNNAQMGINELFDPEAEVDMGLVRGNTDGDGSFLHADFILEIKTDGPSSFGPRSKPSAEHITQAMGLYATGLDKPFVVYLYISKIYPHPIKEYVLPYDKKVFQSWWRKKGRHVEQALASGKEPLADGTAGECRNCPYRSVCTQSLADKAKKTFRRT